MSGDGVMTWQQFVVDHGWRARGDHLAHVLGQPRAAIERVRRSGACRRVQDRFEFAELFARWHGRPPADGDWPLPMKIGGGYEWLGPERALLARLIGTVGTAEVCRILTTRLREVTGDPTAVRDLNAVNRGRQLVGLEVSDVVGGLTTREAAKRVGSLAVVHQAVHSGRLKTVRLGVRHVIPFHEFERWMAARETPPAGWVRLASLAAPLGISSDSKLPEYAALGHIPDVKLVRGIGTARGTWYIDPTRAHAILEAARTGHPMPWHGKPLPGNMRMMWAKWQARRHRHCRICVVIWRGPAPKTIDAFTKEYGRLTLGEKRHLTHRPQTPRPSRRHGSCRGHRAAGLTVYQAARELRQPSRWIRSMIRLGLFAKAGLVRDALSGEALRITPVGMCMLRAAAAADVITDEHRDWFGLHRAAAFAGVSIGTIQKWADQSEVRHTPGPRGTVFERASLERRARQYWTNEIRFKRAAPPAWFLEHAS